MDKKLFFYEFKQIGKYPLFIAAAYAAVWLLCGVFLRFGYNSLDYADFFATALLYAAFFFTVGDAIWRTASFDRLYRKVGKNPLSLLAVRMLTVAICLAAVTLLFLLLGTAMDLIVRAVTPEVTEAQCSGITFTLYRRSPFYVLFFLSVALCGAVVLSAASVPIHAAIGARSLPAKIAAGIFWTAVMAALVLCAMLASAAFPRAPTWGLDKLWAYPMPFDGITAAVFSPSTEHVRFVVKVFYACWNICNLFTLLTGLLLVLFGFCAVAFFRRGHRDEGAQWPAAGAFRGGERRKDL